MPVVGLHCSHEQVHPRALLAAVQQAEAAGFDAAMSSDRFSPWSSRQGHSAFAWSWPGAALQATSLPLRNAVSEHVPLGRVGRAVTVSADLGEHTAQLAEYPELGFDKIFLHHVGQEQDAFVAAFGEKVLPQIRSAS